MAKLSGLIQNSDEWRTWRKGKVGGSLIGSIMKRPDAFTSRKDALMEFCGKEKLLSDFTKKLFADGHAWEETVRDYVNRTELSNFIPMCFEHDERPEFISSTDGFDEEKNQILEVKLTTSAQKFEKFKRGEIPAAYLDQVQWAMMISGAESCRFIMGFNGDAHPQVVKADKDLWQDLAAEAIAFLTEARDIQEAQTGNLFFEELEKIAFLKKTSKEMEEQLKLVDAEIKELAEKIMETAQATVVENGGVKIQWVERQGTVDYSRIEELKGVDLEKYRKKGSRTLKVTVKNDKDTPAIE